MEDDEKNKPLLISSQLTLFKFELSRSQGSLFLILFVMGIFLVSFNLAGEIFFNLFQFIYYILPTYMENPGVYHEDYLFYNSIPIITRIIDSIIFISLSIYGLRRILKKKSGENSPRRKNISQKRTVNYLGLNISHGQSLFIFIASLAGLIFMLQLFLEKYAYPAPRFGLLESINWVQVGPTQWSSNLILLLDLVPVVVRSIFFIVCLYSLFITRRGKPITPSKKVTKNYALLIFIGSFIVFIILSARIFCHLALFNRDVSNLLGITYHAPNSYQNNDFIGTVVFFSVSLVLMISSFFLKKRNHKDIKTSDELSWIRKKLEYIKNSRDFKTNWFKFCLDKINSAILLSTSSILVIFFIYYLMGMNMGAQALYSDFDPLESYLLFSFPFMSIFIIIAIVVNIYTIIKTLPSIKDSKSQKIEKVD